MKRAFIVSILFLTLFRVPAQAQDNAATASAIAAREEADDRAKRMTADIQALQAANEDLQNKITAMEQEIQTLRDAQAKPADNSGVQDDLKRLAEKIEEVDKKRLEDKDAISEEIRKSIGGLERSVAGDGRSSRTSSKTSSAPDNAAPVDGYSYTVQDGDSLLAIVKAYNTDFKSKGLHTITSRQTREANPRVDWNRLRVGQKIIIPKPAGAP